MRQENRERLGAHDVVFASHPGSGTSWIGRLLVHLGVFYASGHDERLVDDHSQRSAGWIEEATQRLPGLTPVHDAAVGLGRPTVGVEEQQRHVPALHDLARHQRAYREPCRVVKTNQTPIGWEPRNRVLLLVRDGRDALLSLYHNLRSFSDLDVPLLPFLQGNDGAWLPPAMSWGFFCLSWLGTPPERLHVLRFETCRERPLEEFRGLLRFLEVERSDRELEEAIAESSYARMRAVEDAALGVHGPSIGAGRVMRKGQVGEWREVYTEEMLATFAGLPRRALERFGYPADTVPG